MPNSHTIEQQYLEVVFTDRREGMGLQDQLAAIYKEKVLPLLESVLNDHDVHDYTVQIDAITIDAGILSAKNWEQELVERSVQQFKSILQQKLLSPWPRRPSAFPGPAAATGKVEGVQWMPEALFHYNRLWQFVNSGTLPVSDGRSTLQPTITVLLKHKAEWQKPENREAWLRLLLNDQQALERLIRQCGGMMEAILDWLYESPVEQASFYIKLSAITDRYTRHALLSSVVLIKKAPGTRSMAAPVSLLQSLFINNRPAAELEDVLMEPDVQMAHLLAKNSELPPAVIKQATSGQEGSSFHVYNAGLIILHPFLVPFFEKTGLLNHEQQWVSTMAHQRAVLLTQYLVTGATSLPEFYLPLNKLLCGYPLAATLDDELAVTEQEQAEAMALLASVIAHWGALKNTSRDALRVAFLQRAGKLTRNEKGWQLVAEQKPFDILLQSIPWTIGRIKTPWMEEWLLTDWV